MKKIIALMAAVLMLVGLTACGGSAKKSGTFTAERSDAAAEAAYGWKDTLTVKYEDGKIVSATYDSVYVAGDSYEIGTKKSTLTVDDYPMTDPTAAEMIEMISKDIAENSKVDKVAGATSASDSAKMLFDAIEKATSADETIIVE